MSNYRRIYIEGGTYFFTVVTHNRRKILCEGKNISRLKEAFYNTKKRNPFKILAIVILPDHLHCIWKLPENDSDYSTRWNSIKRAFSLGIEGISNKRRQKNIWQKRFWEHTIKDDKDFQNCLDYIYYNPVKHGYVKRPSDWRYSSFRRDVSKGVYDINWASFKEPINIKNNYFE